MQDFHAATIAAFLANLGGTASRGAVFSIMCGALDLASLNLELKVGASLGWWSVAGDTVTLKPQGAHLVSLLEAA